MSPNKITANSGALGAILLAGFTAGTLDILSACTQYYLSSGKNPVMVLNYVASGFFGKETAYANGPVMPIAGLLFHYLIAFSFTLFFFWLYPKWKALAWNKFVTAFGYGLFVWAVMNLLVVPMSLTPKKPFDISRAIIAATILICMIGLPVTLIIGNYYAKKKAG